MEGGVFENVAEHLDEAVRLAERCPEKYQIPCFQALIKVLAQSDALPSQNGNGAGYPVLRLTRPRAETQPPDENLSRMRRAL